MERKWEEEVKNEIGREYWEALVLLRWEEREKKSEKGFFFLVVYEYNIKIIDGRATVIMHICTVTIAIMHKCIILHPLMWVFFGVKIYKMGTFFYFRRLYTCWCGCSYMLDLFSFFLKHVIFVLIYYICIVYELHLY